MTIDAKLTLDLDRFVLGAGYYLHTSVVTGDPAKTDPIELYSSILVRLATTTQPDAIARICTYPELNGYPEFTPPNIYGLYQLSGPTIETEVMDGSVMAGDRVAITCPAIWLHINPAITTFITTVYAIAADNKSIVLSDEMPSYATDMTYIISRGSGPFVLVAQGDDAISHRYNPSGEMYCRVTEDYTAFETLSEAINKLAAVRAEAQALVDDYDRSGTEFEGFDEEFYT